MRFVCRYGAMLLAIIALSTGLSVSRSAAQTAAPLVPIEITNEDGFARLVFKWQTATRLNVPPAWTAVIEDDVLVLHFEEAFSLDLDALTAATAGYVAIIRQDSDAKTIRLALKYPLTVKSSASRLDVAIDLYPKKYKGQADEYVAPRPKIDLERLVVTGIIRDVPDAEELRRLQVAPKPIPDNAMRLPVRVINSDARSRIIFEWPRKVGYDIVREGDTLVLNFNEIARPKLARLRIDPPAFVRTANAVKRLGGLEVHIELEPGADFHHFREASDVVVDVVPHATESVAQRNKHEEHEDPVEHENLVEDNSVSVEFASTLDGVEIRFLFEHDTPAAIFRRGDYLWMAFDTDKKIDLSEFKRGSHYEIRDVEDMSAGDFALVRMALGPRALVTARPEAGNWFINLGETAFANTKNIVLERKVEEKHKARIFADMPAANEIHKITDPEVGDELILVTALGPAQGLISSRKNIDFVALASAHGLAIQPVSEDLDVSLHDGIVTITRAGGLSVTGAEEVSEHGDNGRIEVAANDHGDAPSQETPEHGSGNADDGHGDEESPRGPSEPVGDKPGVIDFVGWRGNKADGYYQTLADLNALVNSAPKRELSRRRLKLAQFYFAHGLLAEATGVLDSIAKDDDLFSNTLKYIILNGATRQRMYRNKGAIEALSSFSWKDNVGVALWRGMAFEGLGYHKRARIELARGMADFDFYPEDWQARFQLAETKAALGVNAADDANSMWGNIALDALTDFERADAYLTKGKILYSIGEPALALEYFRKVFPLTDGEMAHRARYNELMMLNEVGELDDEEVTERLEQLRFQWRGDDLELKVLRSLGEVYLNRKLYHQALSVMRVGFTFKPQHPISRDMRDRMGDVFEELFIEGEADSLRPAEAVTLFYDFKELTPIGTKGDRMIRLLSERLVAIGLLDQAAELIKHQIDYRLKGAPRAQVAMRLALIQLRNKRPEEAFRVLSSTRFAGLTPKLINQRRLIEARALADMGRHVHAIELLEDDVSRQADDMRANIFWDADNWPETGRIYEEILENDWGNETALSNETRAKIMRMTIAYALVDDRPALDRIRRKFGPKMASSPDARAFTIATDDKVSQGVAFRDVLRRVSSVDTLEAFMTDFKIRFGKEEILENQGF